ncbi:MAG: RNase adapter RapZ [Clostridium sp.]|uniref:RNase adapter RapZ n=1 Tax=Clostridium sp. TaxID=1506 RepID=UPI002FC6241C
MRFLVVTGLSGAGKTQAIRCLEDLNYFCIENIPPSLIPKFAELSYKVNDKVEKIAIVIDVRGGKFFDELFNGLCELNNMGYKYEILFLDASDETLVKRFKESRRTHPLSKKGRILTGIQEERNKLSEVREKADHVIDTSNLSTKGLKEKIKSIYGTWEREDGFIINVMSFGFKYGMPIDADLVFDVRFLPNPYYIDELRSLSGNDKEIKDYVTSFEVTKEFISKVNNMLEFLIPYYIEEGKTQLVVAIGCTGGRHRSVVMANAVHEFLKDNHNSEIIHRDISHDATRDVK